MSFAEVSGCRCQWYSVSDLQPDEAELVVEVGRAAGRRRSRMPVLVAHRLRAGGERRVLADLVDDVRWQRGLARTTATGVSPSTGPSSGQDVLKHHAYTRTGKKVKFSRTRYRALGPEPIPVYRQSARRWREVNHATDPAVGCRYFLPGLQLPP